MDRTTGALALQPMTLGRTPPADNDAGQQPHDPRTAVLLSCTGATGERFRLDVLLRTARADVVVGVGLPQIVAIARARLLSACYGAPLSMISVSGETVLLEEAPPMARRRGGSPLSSRRPRFLVRRKAGAIVSAA